MTFLELATKVLSETQLAMSASEVWDYAIQKGFATELGSTGKTPDITLGSRVYIDIKQKGEKSTFV